MLTWKIQTTTIYQYLNCTPFTPFSDRVFKIESDTCFPKGKPYNVLTIKIYTRKVSLKYVSLQIPSVMSINLSSIQCSIYTVHRAWGTGVWESNLEPPPPHGKKEKINNIVLILIELTLVTIGLPQVSLIGQWESSMTIQPVFLHQWHSYPSLWL